MATDNNTLVNNARCIETCIPGDMKLAVLITLFAKIAGVSTDPNTLIANAKCVEQCVPIGMQLPILISLADQINQGGSVSASGGVTGGNGAPTVAPASGFGIYIQADSIPPGVLWEYYNGAWH